MSFTKINYDTELFYKLLQNNLNLEKDKINIFIDLINKPYISISGSSILQILSKEFYSNSDLDIYVELETINLNEVVLILNFLYSEFENLDLKKINNDMIIFKNKYNEYMYNITNNDYINYINKYDSLQKYLKFLLTFTNINNKKIDLIFISKNIEILLENTFDYDIVKNYWKENNIYSYNIFSIYNKIATMTLKHFTNRVLNNHYEFNNFIKRYKKYSSRGYNIFINKIYIKEHIFKYLITIYEGNPYKKYRNLFPYYEKLNNIYYHAVYIETKYIYNSKLVTLYLEKKQHITKFILIYGLIQKYKFQNNINNYSNMLLEEYLHPESIYIKYKLNQEYRNTCNILINNKNMYYILNNQLKVIRFQ
jgi:hypothetical protein